MQKCQKYGVLDRKINFSHLFLDITSQFFHTIIYESCSFYSCKKIRNRIRPIDRKNDPKSDLKISIFENACEKIQYVYHSIELEKLSNFCEDTSWLSIMVWEWYLKNQNLMSIFKKMIQGYFHIVHCKKLDSRSALRTRGRCEQHASRSRRGMHCEFIIQTGFPLSFIFFNVSFVIFIIIR